ncbi:hypothetical protein, partial [Dechloromonas denitrificans]|uniref:hypothetical protein n=1 Tax=Dechloromonas denitrificans TaxID=281362 RepID=UPI001470375C
IGDLLLRFPLQEWHMYFVIRIMPNGFHHFGDVSHFLQLCIDRAGKRSQFMEALVQAVMRASNIIVRQAGTALLLGVTAMKRGVIRSASRVSVVELGCVRVINGLFGKFQKFFRRYAHRGQQIE